MSIADPVMTPPAPRSTAAAPTASVRDPRLDFFRGIAMFIILIAHTPGNWFTLWIPARFGFSDATEMFVFCSGMASAIAFGKVFEQRGVLLGTARVGFRVWQVYWAHIGLFLAIAATMAALNASGAFERDYVGQLNLYPFFRNTAENLPALLTLTYVPNYFDILPMYLVILAMMPLVVGLKKIHLGLAAAFVLVLWFVAQEGVQQEYLVQHAGSRAFWPVLLELPAEPWSEREWFFNPFGWQLVFFTGFAFMAGWLPAPPVNRVLIALALIIVIGNVALSNIGIRELGFDWARDWRIANREWITKTDFGLLRFVQFLSLAYLAWIAAGPGGAWLMRLTQHSATRGLMALILKVGQQSLPIFITSMFLARLMGVAFDVLGRSHGTMILVNGTGALILVAVAYSVGWIKAQPWKRQRGAGNAAA
ncbi:MAG: OpgC domain-containing protein [Pseudomonadota bacterium]